MPIGPGSQQLRLFRRAIRSGATLEEACAATGNIIGPVEGRIYIESDRKDPPPEEAFELLYDPDAPAAASQPKEAAMAGRRMAREKSEEQTQEIPQKDFAEAVKIYRNDIKPAKTKQGEFGQEQSTAYKAIKKNCHIQPQAAKLAFSVSEMEEAHRDDFLFCLYGLFKELEIVMPRNLVTIAEGQDGGSVIPIGERQRPQLATLQMGVPSDGTETDLADAGEFEEASEEELAAQEGRPSNDAGDDEPEAEAAE